MRLYHNMKSRIKGIQTKKWHLYKNKSLLNKERFYLWALSNPTFHKLFLTYQESGYEIRLAPSVDRIDSKKGYFIKNMEFVTQSENSRRGSMSRHYSHKVTDHLLLERENTNCFYHPNTQQ